MKKIISLLMISALSLLLIGCNPVKSIEKTIKKSPNIVEKGSVFLDGDVNGELQYKITGASVYHSLSSAGLKISDCTEPESYFFENDLDSFKEGYCLLILDVTANNINAENNSKGQDKYTFRADSVNLVTIKDGNVEPASDVLYFDKHDKCEEHPFAYKLPKGESCSFKIGNVVAEEDLPVTYASNCSAYSKNAVYISLDCREVD